MVDSPTAFALSSMVDSSTAFTLSSMVDSSTAFALPSMVDSSTGYSKEGWATTRSLLLEWWVSDCGSARQSWNSCSDREYKIENVIK